MIKHKEGEIFTSNDEVYIQLKTKKEKYYRYLVNQYLSPYTIPKGYTIHHIDGDHTHNSLDNFFICPTYLHVHLHRCCKPLNILTSNLEQFRKLLEEGKII